MGWILWGLAFGWGAAAIYYHNMCDEDHVRKANDGASVVFMMLLVAAFVISINLGMASGVIGPDITPTPTSLGR